MQCVAKEYPDTIQIWNYIISRWKQDFYEIMKGSALVLSHNSCQVCRILWLYNTDLMFHLYLQTFYFPLLFLCRHNIQNTLNSLSNARDSWIGLQSKRVQHWRFTGNTCLCLVSWPKSSVSRSSSTASLFLNSSFLLSLTFTILSLSSSSSSDPDELLSSELESSLDVVS